jgi:hypothetical protein
MFQNITIVLSIRACEKKKEQTLGRLAKNCGNQKEAEFLE